MLVFVAVGQLVATVVPSMYTVRTKQLRQPQHQGDFIHRHVTCHCHLGYECISWSRNYAALLLCVLKHK